MHMIKLLNNVTPHMYILLGSCLLKFMLASMYTNEAGETNVKWRNMKYAILAYDVSHHPYTFEMTSFTKGAFNFAYLILLPAWTVTHMSRVLIVWCRSRIVIVFFNILPLFFVIPCYYFQLFASMHRVDTILVVLN